MGIFDIQYVTTVSMPADSLTKPLKTKNQEELRCQLALYVCRPQPA